MGETSEVTSLASCFARLKGKDEKALVVFFTAGDQPLDQLPEIVSALAEGGADIVEIGVPFSDPFGEGPTIQASSQRALENGVTPKAILDAMGNVKTDLPLVTMGYYNPVLRFGLEGYASASKEAGATGVIISDLVPDEAGPWAHAAERIGVETIFLVAPTSTQARIDEVAELSTGFVYVVSRTGVTGAENQVPGDVVDLVRRVKDKTEKPVCVGFGISSPDHVRMVCSVADGAVVGSALVQMLHKHWNGGAGRSAIVEFVASLKAATRA